MPAFLAFEFQLANLLMHAMQPYGATPGGSSRASECVARHLNRYCGIPQVDVCGRPSKGKRNLTFGTATCSGGDVSGLVARLQHAAGLLWNAWIRSNSARGAQGTRRLNDSSDPVSDRCP